MRVVAEALKAVGALGIATILGHPATFPQAGPGLLFFLLTFGWPLVFVPLLLFLPHGPVAIVLRAIEVPLWGWTAFMTCFAAGMDPGAATYVLLAARRFTGSGPFSRTGWRSVGRKYARTDAWPSDDSPRNASKH